MDFDDFLTWEASTKDMIDFKKVYVDMAGGDVLAGLVLSEIIYWYLPSKKGGSKLRVKREGKWWIAERRYKWWERTRMNPRQFDRAINILLDQGLIEKKVYKFQGQTTVHIRLLEEIFLSSFKTMMKYPPKNPNLPLNIPENHESVNLDSPNGESQESPNGESGITDSEDAYTEVTTEGTSEDTYTITGAGSAVVVGKEKKHTCPADKNLDEPVYDEAGEEFGDSGGKRKRPKWQSPTSDLCKRALATCNNRKYFGSHDERSRWIAIEKTMTPLDDLGRVKMPEQWVNEMIDWAKKMNARGPIIGFPALLSSIENEEKKKIWVSQMLKNPDRLSDELVVGNPFADIPDEECYIPASSMSI